MLCCPPTGGAPYCPVTWWPPEIVRTPGQPPSLKDHLLLWRQKQLVQWITLLEKSYHHSLSFCASHHRTPYPDSGIIEAAARQMTSGCMAPKGVTFRCNVSVASPIVPMCIMPSDSARNIGSGDECMAIPTRYCEWDQSRSRPL